MSKFQWSEIFTSIEGEGPYTGVPTTYIRFTKCNFTCAGFNNPKNVEITNEVLGFDPIEVKSLDDCPPIVIGCDSIYSWDKRFKHMWKSGNELELAEETMKFVPGNKWVNKDTGTATMLSLTGGEPTLRAKQIPALLNNPLFDELQTILIETNCSVKFKPDFVKELDTWRAAKPNRKIVWSNSPKLVASGEPWEKAIVPEIAVMQNQMESEQYFKFVCGPHERDFEEVLKAMEAYWAAGVPKQGNNIYVMPVSCISDQQNDIAAEVANMCIKRGLIYCHRVHLDVYGNAIGT